MFRLYDDDLNPETNSQPLEAPTSPTSPQKPTETKFSAMKRSKEPKTRLQMFKLLLSAGGLLVRALVAVFFDSKMKIIRV